MRDVTRRGFVGGAVLTSLLVACGTQAPETPKAVPQDGAAPETETTPEVEETPEETEEAEEMSAEETLVDYDASGFVLLADAVPDVIQEIRYYTTYNFVGDRIDGYEEPLALITREAGEALRLASDALIGQGYRLKVFDAYRPQRAVNHFERWAADIADTRMQPYFYPDLDKSVLFDLGYINHYSGHTRGSTVDLTLFDMAAERDADMGGTFDWFGERSHPGYAGVTEEQYANRMLLQSAMINAGFEPISTEWWHFTLAYEPYPDTYFDFPVNSASLG